MFLDLPTRFIKINLTCQTFYSSFLSFHLISFLFFSLLLIINYKTNKITRNKYFILTTFYVLIRNIVQHVILQILGFPVC